jgi:hypothetical protein
MKRKLIAGANSYFGKYFVEALKRQGYWVRWALSRNKTKLGKSGPFGEPAIFNQIGNFSAIARTYRQFSFSKLIQPLNLKLWAFGR